MQSMHPSVRQASLQDRNPLYLLTEDDIAEVEALAQAFYDSLDAMDAEDAAG